MVASPVHWHSPEQVFLKEESFGFHPCDFFPLLLKAHFNIPTPKRNGVEQIFKSFLLSQRHDPSFPKNIKENFPVEVTKKRKSWPWGTVCESWTDRIIPSLSGQELALFLLFCFGNQCWWCTEIITHDARTYIFSQHHTNNFQGQPILCPQTLTLSSIPLFVSVCGSPSLWGFMHAP